VIRVGFPLIGGAAWLGGRNYLWNLLRGISLVEDRQLQPVLLRPQGENFDVPAESFVRTGALARPLAARLGSATRYLLGRDLVEQRWMARARLDVLSHSGPIGKSRIPWIFWVPDLQHRHFPEFFGRFEGWLRDTTYRSALRDATRVVTSSAAVRDDLVRFYGADRNKLRQLPFVSSPRVELSALPSREALAERLRLPPRYFHLPNQFWKHKNHRVVVEALERAPEVVVLCTGAKEDYRNPGWFDELMAEVERKKLSSRFRHLGTVSYDDLMALMRYSLAVINPSLFEGWSSTVEEARSMGKRVLLSDIAVHREQNPARGRFFPPHDAAALASLLTEEWREAEEDEAAIAEAAAALPGRMRAFGEAYQRIVLDATRGSS
jgi:hypothetical protein